MAGREHGCDDQPRKTSWQNSHDELRQQFVRLINQGSPSFQLFGPSHVKPQYRYPDDGKQPNHQDLRQQMHNQRTAGGLDIAGRQVTLDRI